MFWSFASSHNIELGFGQQPIAEPIIHHSIPKKEEFVNIDIFKNK
jgi:hypothetical protein